MHGETLARAESEEASRRTQQLAEAEKKALIGQLSAPSGVSEGEGVRRSIRIIERAKLNCQ